MQLFTRESPKLSLCESWNEMHVEHVPLVPLGWVLECRAAVPIDRLGHNLGFSLLAQTVDALDTDPKVLANKRNSEYGGKVYCRCSLCLSYSWERPLQYRIIPFL